MNANEREFKNREKTIKVAQDKKIFIISNTEFTRRNGEQNQNRRQSQRRGTKEAEDLKGLPLLFALNSKEFLSASVSPWLGFLAQQPRRIATKNSRLIFLRNRQSPDAFQHLRNAPDLMRIIAARQNLPCPGE
jgi:hypothetical protein